VAEQQQQHHADKADVGGAAHALVWGAGPPSAHVIAHVSGRVAVRVGLQMAIG
jgi:hypothetical protein